MLLKLTQPALAPGETKTKLIPPHAAFGFIGEALRLDLSKESCCNCISPSVPLILSPALALVFFSDV